jgi:hypothetical protein
LIFCHFEAYKILKSFATSESRKAEGVEGEEFTRNSSDEEVNELKEHKNERQTHYSKNS